MWTKSPLLHFAVLGSAAFVLHGLVLGPGRPDSTRIEVSSKDIQRMRAMWTAQWKRPPTEGELQGLIDASVRQEILYREALALGLDEGDTVIRRRLAQKVELLADDLASRTEPTREELSRYFEEHRDAYTLPARVSFSHIYFSVDRRGDRAEADAEEALKHPDDAQGDPFMLQRDYPSRTEREVGELFGTEFAKNLFELEPGEWHGPIASSYGVHLVLVRARTEARQPELSEVSHRVRADLMAERRREAKEALVTSLRERYEIVVDRP